MIQKNGGSEAAADISRQAAYWCLRLKDSERLHLKEGLQFLAWLMRSQRHVHECVRFWRLDDRLTRLMRAKRDQSNVTHVNWWQGSSRQPSEMQPPRRLRSWSIAATVLLMISVSFFLGKVHDEASNHAVKTVDHETKTRQLEDGSTVSLQASSMLEVEFTDLRRDVHFSRGRALFDVAMDMKRPFVVSTFLVDIAAVESTFSVSIDTSVEVMVHEGMVEISGRGAKGRSPVVTVKKGETYRVPVERFGAIGMKGGSQVLGVDG